MTVPKFHFIALELLLCDNYRPVTIFWPCPEVVTISDNHCIHIDFTMALLSPSLPPAPVPYLRPLIRLN